MLPFIHFPRPSKSGPGGNNRSHVAKLLGDSYSRRHDHLRMRIRHWHWEHCMAAKRALPAVGSLAGIRVGHCHELGQQFHRRTDLFADDAIHHSAVDIFRLCGDLRSRLGLHVEDLSRNQGLRTGRCSRSFDAWMGSSGKSWKTIEPGAWCETRSDGLKYWEFSVWQALFHLFGPFFPQKEAFGDEMVLFSYSVSRQRDR